MLIEILKKFTIHWGEAIAIDIYLSLSLSLSYTLYEEWVFYCGCRSRRAPQKKRNGFFLFYCGARLLRCRRGTYCGDRNLPQQLPLHPKFCHNLSAFIRTHSYLMLRYKNFIFILDVVVLSFWSLRFILLFRVCSLLEAMFFPILNLQVSVVINFEILLLKFWLMK